MMFNNRNNKIKITVTCILPIFIYVKCHNYLNKKTDLMLKKLQLSILLTLFASAHSYSQITKVQIINNIADVSTPVVDVWVNNVKVNPDLPFRMATAFTNYSTNTPFNIGIALAQSNNITDTFRSKTITLSPANEYIIVLNGIKSSTGYSPLKPVSIDICSTAKTTSAGNVDVMFANMATDAPAYDFRSGTQTVGNNLSYGSFSSGYTTFSPVAGKVRTTNDNGNVRYSTYETSFDDPSLLNKAAIILTSGFLTPSANSNGPSMGLWMASADGGNLIELKTTSPEPIARVQFIHNCADTTGDTIDVYAGSERAINDFVFRNSTPFVEFYGNTPITFGIAPRNSSSSADASYTQTITFDSLGTHVVVANGIKSAAGYSPLTPFRLTKYNNARETPTNNSDHDVLFCNGSTDATNLTVNTSSGTWFSNIAFDNFAGYQSVAASAATVLGLAGTSGSYGSFITNFPGQGEALTLVACGFADSTKNSKGPKLHLYYARPSGGALVRLPVYSVSVPGVENERSTRIYPNPANDILYIKSKAPIQRVSIVNTVGVQVKNIQTQVNTVDISNLPTGVYIAEVQTTNGKITQSFIKQ